MGMDVSTVPRSVMITTNIKRYVATPRSRPLTHLIHRYNPIIGISSFTRFNGSDSIRLKGFDRIWLRFFQLDLAQILWRDLTHVFPTQFNPRFLYVFNSISWLDLSRSFWRDSTQVFLIKFDSRLTPLFSNRVTKFDPHSSQASGSPTLTRVSSK